MAVTEAFLADCRAPIAASPELTAFQTARAAFDSASHDERGLYWHAAYGDGQTGLSPAYRLRKFIRETVMSLREASMSHADQESAIASLGAQYAPSADKPMSAADEQAALQTLIIQELAS